MASTGSSCVETMQIFARTCEGSTVVVDVSASDGVEELCSQLDHQRGGVEAEGVPGRRLIVNGLQLAPNFPLADQGVREGCTVVEVGTLRGGGCDGGTTALQRKFMSQATSTKKDEVRDEAEEKRAKWTMCAASGEPLGTDLVACNLGYLFNKETILKKLALKKETPLHPNFRHISKRKDLFSVVLEPNPEYDALKGTATAADSTRYSSRFICPIIKRPANGVSPFVAFRPCGHVVSEQCVKEIKDADGGPKCIVCGAAYDKETEMIVLNPAAPALAERRKALMEKIGAERAAAKEAKAEAGGKRAHGEESAEAKADKKDKRAKLMALAGAGASVGGITGKLSTAIDASKKGGALAHAAKASRDANYASLFKQDRKGVKEYDAAWGQGAMAGVLGSR